MASIIEIDSLTLRLMPSLGVRATKMPPERPRPTRIRCELASSRSPSRSVGRLTPNSAASSCSVPIRSPGLEPFALQIAADLERDLMARVDARRRKARGRELGGGGHQRQWYGSAIIKSFLTGVVASGVSLVTYISKWGPEAEKRGTVERRSVRTCSV